MSKRDYIYNSRRKYALTERASRYASANANAGYDNSEDGTSWSYEYTREELSRLGFEDGYRAAMEDLRKALKNPDPTYMNHQEGVANAALMFARPLR